MKFYFKNGFCKFSRQSLVVLAITLCSSSVLAQVETNTLPVLVHQDLIETNASVVVDVSTNVVGIAELPTKTDVVEISNQTKLAIAALEDGVFSTASKYAREELKKCSDFSTIDAELLFHVVMYVNQAEILGVRRSIELLDSKERFTELWGAAEPTGMPEELSQAALFWKACCLAELNKRQEAIAILRGLVNENKFKYQFLKVEALRRLCYELVLTGELEEAAIYYATKDLPPTTDQLCGEAVAFFRLGHAQVLFQLNKHGEAEQVLKQLIEEQGSLPTPKATAVLFNMELLLVREQASGAVTLFRNYTNEKGVENISPRLEALLLCKYAHALALASDDSAAQIGKALESAVKAVDKVYSSEERMICLETLIHVLAALKHFDEVKIKLTELLEYAPNSLYVARILRQVAQDYQGGGEFEQAYWAYQLYLHSFTNSPHEYDTMIDSGDCLVLMGRLDEAALRFKRASEFATEPGKKNLANFKAGETYFKSNRFMQAAESFAKLISGVKGQEELWVAGQLYHAQAIEQFDLPSAKLIYKQLATSDDISLKEPALIAIAALSVNDGELTQALEYYTKLIELSKETPRDSYALGLLGRGLVELKISRYNDALKSFEQAEQIKDGGEYSTRAAFLKAEALYSLGQETVAYSNTVAFLERFPESPLVMDANFWLAKHDFNTHKYEQAEQRFLEFCKKWSDSPQASVAHLLAIHAMMQQEKYGAVVANTALWVDSHGDEDMLADVQFLNGEARSKLLQFDSAVRSYAQAAKNAKSEELRQRAIMRQADCLYTLGADNPARYEEAIPIYNELMIIPNQHRSVVMQMAYKLAKCYEKQGKYDDAIENYYEKIVLQAEGWARESSGVEKEIYLQAIGGTVWYARAIVDATALYEKQGTPEALKRAEELLGRLVNSSLPFADEAKMTLERIQAKNTKLLILNEE